MVNRMAARTGAVFGVSVVLAALLATPAQAAIGKNGTVGCSGSKPFAYVQFKTKGHRSWIAPGTGAQLGQPGSDTTWYSGSREGKKYGGYWFASGTVDLDTVYTTGVCQAFGAN